MQLMLLAVVAATRLADASASLDLKERPVAKVISLLKEMQTDLTREGEQDEELYEKLSCWCETNGKDKTAAIEEANRRIDGLTSDIERLGSQASSLTSSIATLNEEISRNDAALDQASEMRAKELAEFNAEEKDMIASIRSLDGAVTALEKHQTFLQVGSSVDVSSLRRVMGHAKLEVSQRTQLEAFLDQAPSAGSYSSQSGAIFGILSQMKESFEENLTQSKKDETQAASEFASLKAAKTEEIRSATSMVDSQTQELAEAEEQRAAAKQNLKDTEAALKADTGFLRDLRSRCANADQEYETRSKTRNEEIQAISETIGILNSDESHDLMASTLGFVQKDTRRAKAVRALRRAGLEKLAVLAGIDAFEKVQAAINEMVAALKTEMSDEVAHKDFCDQELAENDEQTAVSQDELDDLGTTVADRTSTIETLTKELGSATAQVKQSKIQMQRASEDRESENAEFQATVADQRAVQQILTKAHARLQQFYGDRSLLQVKVHTRLASEPGAEAPAAPEGFSEFKKNEKSGGVMGLIQGILDEAHEMEMDALKAEADSQAAYEAFTKDSNESITTLNRAITDKSAGKARAEAELIQAQSGHKTTLDDLERLHVKKQTLHSSCDYVMDNFDARQAARGAEIQALGEAKAILSGAQ